MKAKVDKNKEEKKLSPWTYKVSKRAFTKWKSRSLWNSSWDIFLLSKYGKFVELKK